MIPGGMYPKRTLIIRGMVPYGAERCVCVCVCVCVHIHCHHYSVLRDTDYTRVCVLQSVHQLHGEQISGHRLPHESPGEGGRRGEKQHDWRKLGPGGQRAQHEPLLRGTVLRREYYRSFLRVCMCEIIPTRPCPNSPPPMPQMSIRCGGERFTVFVNGQHLFDYFHRLQSFNEIDMLEIEGDVQISYIHFWAHTHTHTHTL